MTVTLRMGHGTSTILRMAKRARCHTIRALEKISLDRNAGLERNMQHVGLHMHHSKSLAHKCMCKELKKVK